MPTRETGYSSVVTTRTKATPLPAADDQASKSLTSQHRSQCQVNEGRCPVIMEAAQYTLLYASFWFVNTNKRTGLGSDLKTARQYGAVAIAPFTQTKREKETIPHYERDMTRKIRRNDLGESGGDTIESGLLDEVLFNGILA